MLNSDELRASYNACLPLLSNYWTDLAQSEPLFRAYSAIAANEAGTLDGAQRRVLERALEDFRLAGVGLPRDRKERYKAVVQELAQLGAKFEENVLDAMNAWTRHVTDAAELSGINPVIVEQARERAVAKGVDGWLFALEQPTYVAVMTDADSEALRRDFYEAWTTRASDRGPVRRQVRQHRRSCRRSSRCATRRRSCWISLTTPRMRSPRAWRRPPTRCSISCASWRASRKPAARTRIRRARSSSPAAGSTPGTWVTTPRSCRQKLFTISQEELRPYFPLPRVLDGLFAVAENLFGVKIVERKGVPL